ncbi:MAG: O-antigen ligase family protein [Spirochaetia bacterium]|nr:O-antigen ligase family protein [Spirochaetia bacterium]
MNYLNTIYNKHKKLNTILLSTLFILTPLAYIKNVIENSLFAKLFIFYFIIAIISLINFYFKNEKTENKEKFIRNDLILIFILLLFTFSAWNIICTIFSLKPVIALGKTIEIIGNIFIALFVFIIAKNISLIRVLYWAIYGSIFVSFIGILQRFNLIEIFQQVASPAATFVNKNIAGHYIGFIFFFSLLLFFTSKSKKLFYFSIFAIILQIIYSFFIASKGLFISLIFTGIYIYALFVILKKSKNYTFISYNKKKKKILIYVLLITITTVHLIEVYYPVKNKDNPVLQEIASSGFIKGKSGSVKNRLAVWRNSLEIIKDYPLLGVGPNNFQIIYAKYSRVVKSDYDFAPNFIYTKTHNDYLQYFVETGILGGFLFLSIPFLIFFLTLLALKNNNTKEYKAKIYLTFISASLFYNFFYAFFEFSVNRSPAAGTLMWPLIGIWLHNLNKIMPKSKIKISKKIKTNIYSFFNKEKIIISCLMFSVSMFIIMLFNMIGARYFLEAYVQRTNKKYYKFSCELFTKNINKGVMYMPFFMDAKRLRANEFVFCNEPTEKNLEILESYHKYNPYDLLLMHNIIKYNYNLKKYEKTEFMVDEYLKIYPNSPEILIYKGNLLVLKNRLNEARKWYNQILGMDISLKTEDKIFIYQRLKELEEKIN